MWYSNVSKLRLCGLKKQEGTDLEFINYEFINHDLNSKEKNKIISDVKYKSNGMLSSIKGVTFIITNICLVGNNIRIYFKRIKHRVPKMLSLEQYTNCIEDGYILETIFKNRIKIVIENKADLIKELVEKIDKKEIDYIYYHSSIYKIDKYSKINTVGALLKENVKLVIDII